MAPLPFQKEQVSEHKRQVAMAVSDRAVTAIMKASTVPVAMPFSIRAWTIGITPAELL